VIFLFNFDTIITSDSVLAFWRASSSSLLRVLVRTSEI